jgi:hypothetical protein
MQGNKHNFVVITGMHRSGTSLFANYMQHCGLFLGDSLLPGNTGNERGHYEDVHVLNLHESILRKNGLAYVVESIEFIKPTPGKPDFEQAVEIVKGLAVEPISGFKEPRTSLFLDFWSQVLESEYEKRFIFLFRNPHSVVDSILRRGTDPGVTSNPSLGYISWYVYNKALKEFYDKNPEECLFIEITDLIRSPESKIELINRKLGLNLDYVPFDSVFHSEEFKSKNASETVTSAKGISPELSCLCESLYEQLRLIVSGPFISN